MRSGEHCQGSGIACPECVHDVSLSLFDGGSREQAVAVFIDFNRLGVLAEGLKPRTVKLLGGGVSAVGCAAVFDVISLLSSCLVT